MTDYDSLSGACILRGRKCPVCKFLMLPQYSMDGGGVTYDCDRCWEKELKKHLAQASDSTPDPEKSDL